MSDRSGTNRGSLFLLLFGVPLLAVGCLIGSVAIRMLTEYLGARGWSETPATIEFVWLDTHHSRKGFSTHQVSCTYTYRFKGRDYRGYRVGFTTAADYIGSWHQDTYARLNDAHARNQTVPCFVNPADPSQALLDRDLRFWFLFFLLAVAVGFGGIGAALIASETCNFLEKRRQRRYQERAGATDNQPGLSDPSWTSGTIRLGSASRIAWATGAAVFWNLVWLPLLFFLPGQVAKGDYLALPTLICPLIGLALIAWAVRAVIQHRRFGRSH